jgi:hypothetical protein
VCGKESLSRHTTVSPFLTVSTRNSPSIKINCVHARRLFDGAHCVGARSRQDALARCAQTAQLRDPVAYHITHLWLRWARNLSMVDDAMAEQRPWGSRAAGVVLGLNSQPFCCVASYRKRRLRS